jgi:hypothetical protein
MLKAALQEAPDGGAAFVVGVDVAGDADLVVTVADGFAFGANGPDAALRALADFTEFVGGVFFGDSDQVARFSNFGGSGIVYWWKGDSRVRRNEAA